MRTYTYTTLTDETREDLSAGRYSRQELDQLYASLQEKVEAGKKKMKTVLIILTAVYLLAILPALKDVWDMGGSNIGWAFLSALFPLPIFALGYVLARWHTYGMFCSQFNKAMKKGYPDLAEEYKL